MEETPKKRGPGRPPKIKQYTDEDTLSPGVAVNALQNMEPGDNTKYLRHAMMVKNMPIIDRTDPKQVEQRIDEYFVLCAQNDVKPTVTGFLMSLRVPKTTLWEWKNGKFRAETHQAIILRAYDMLEALWEDYMMNGKINPVSGIFLGKNNFGYQDKQEYVLTPNANGETVSPEEIQAKYAELPED